MAEQFTRELDANTVKQVGVNLRRFIRSAEKVYIASSAGVNHKQMADELGIPVPPPPGMDIDAGKVLQDLFGIEFADGSDTLGISGGSENGALLPAREKTVNVTKQTLGRKYTVGASRLS